ncbi:MAG TPA: PA2169 family four-helix-bundle protein [Tepidisphaeraceae bacterium]|nr:PA2169 family four-helix-bundle protein [Tepidisphaeraceae bacterium]
MNATQDTAKLLNDLHQTLLDSRNGFKTAAQAVKDPVLTDELMAYSFQRDQFARQIGSLIEAIGEKTSEGGSMSGALQRGWMNLEIAISSNDRHAILSECERGEDVALEEFRRAVEAGSPVEFDPVITDQLATVRATHDRIKSLRDAAKQN